MKNNTLEKAFVPKDAAKYDLSRRLFFDKVPLKDIAKRVGVSAQTLTSWKQKGAWEERRNAQILSPKTLYNNLKQQLKKLIDEGDPKGNADAIAKICKQIKELQRDTTVDDIINVVTEMSDWIVKNGKSLGTTNDFFVELTRIQDIYIQSMIDKHSILE